MEINELLESNPNPSKYVLKELIRNSKNLNVDKWDSGGTSLIAYFDNELLEYALQHGADPNIHFNYGQPLIYDNIPEDDRFMLLVKYGANITNIIYNFGTSKYDFSGLKRLKMIDYNLYIEYILKNCLNDDKIYNVINFEILDDDVNVLKLINISINVDFSKLTSIERKINSFEVLEFLYQNGYNGLFENKSLVYKIIESQNQIQNDFLADLFIKEKIPFDTFLISENFYFSYLFDKIFLMISEFEMANYIFEILLINNLEDNIEKLLKCFSSYSEEKLTEICLILLQLKGAIGVFFIERMLQTFPYINIYKYNDIGINIKDYSLLFNLKEILEIIEEKELIEYRRIREQSKIISQNNKIINNHYQRQIKEVYDPISLEYYTIKEFLMGDKNFILKYSNKMYGFNVDSINENIIVCEWHDTYNNTLKYGAKYYNLDKIGISSGLVNKEDFDNIICKSLDIKIISICRTNKKCNGIFQYYLKNIYETYFDIVEKYGFDIELQNGLTSYTKYWDVYIHKYLRYQEEDRDRFLLNDEDFIHNYEFFGKTPEDALKSIKKTINAINLAFLEAPKVNNPFTVYRGVKEEYYEDSNVSFISTTVNENSAYQFSNTPLDLLFGSSEKLYIIYRLKLNKGVSYISLSGISNFEREKEILLPIGLTIKKVKETLENKLTQNVSKYLVKYIDFEVYPRKEEILCRECKFYDIVEII